MPQGELTARGAAQIDAHIYRERETEREIEKERDRERERGRVCKGPRFWYGFLCGFVDLLFITISK